MPCELKIENGRSSHCPKQSSLLEMLDKITADNKHSLEWDDADTRGFEQW